MKSEIPLLAIAIACVGNLNAAEPAFRSKLFKKATLVYADEFDGGKYHGRYGHHKAKKRVEGGSLVINPLDPKRGYVLGTLYRIPEKFVCQFRFKLVSKAPGTGVGFHIGNHKMIVGSNRAEKEIVNGYRLLLRKSKPGKSFTDPKAGKLAANDWVAVVIEYEEGRMLLNINGSEKIYEDKLVSMDGSNLINFKSFSAAALQFDYVRLWKVTE